MLFVSLGSIFMLTYLQNPIWRPSAILVMSYSLLLTPFSRVIPLILLSITHFGMQNSFLMLFSSLGSIHMLIYLPNPKWRPSAILEKSSSLFLIPFSRVAPLRLLILVCRIHLWCYFQHWGGQFSCLLTYQIKYSGLRLYSKTHLLCLFNMPLLDSALSSDENVEHHLSMTLLLI